MKRILLAMTVALVLSACGSAVKLDNTPVEDRTGTNVSGSKDGTKTDAGQVADKNIDTTNLEKMELDKLLATTPTIVYFDYDSFVIRAEFQSVIEAHARFLKAKPTRKVILEGHTDERGGREYNLALGQKRAEAVRKALLLQGVTDGQLEAVSFGKEKPTVQGSSEAAMEKNRRAVFSYR